MHLFIKQLMTTLVLFGMVFSINWEMFHRRISLNLVLLLLEVYFGSRSRLELMYTSFIVNIILHVKSHSSTWFLAACTDAKAHTNNFFCLYHKNKSFAYKKKFRQPSNCCKRILEADSLAYGNIFIYFFIFFTYLKHYLKSII